MLGRGLCGGGIAVYGDVDVQDGRCYASSDCEETSERASSHRARPTPVVMEQRQPRDGGFGGLSHATGVVVVVSNEERSHRRDDVNGPNTKESRKKQNVPGMFGRC